MNVDRIVPAAVVCASLLWSCTSVHRDESDRNAFFVDARVRENLGESEHQGGHFELGWNSVEGDTGDLEYSIGTVAFGFGIEWVIADSGWAGFVGGIAWQKTHFESTTDDPLAVDDFDSQDSLGPFVAIQGGWMATKWLEPFARADVEVYIPESSSAFGVEVGARFHVIDHAAVFAGWRYARYDVNDLDSLAAIDSLDLDTSGLVVGVEFSF